MPHTPTRGRQGFVAIPPGLAWGYDPSWCPKERYGDLPNGQGRPIPCRQARAPVGIRLRGLVLPRGSSFFLLSQQHLSHRHFRCRKATQAFRTVDKGSHTHFGGTCLSALLSEGPACHVRFRRDLLVRSAFHGGTRLSGPINTDRCPIALHRARQACPSRRHFRIRGFRRDGLVTSAFPTWMIRRLSRGTPVVPADAKWSIQRREARFRWPLNGSGNS